MKYFLIIILTAFTLNSVCQNESADITSLTKTRDRLTKEIGILQDSLNKIDKSITYLESNLLLSKYVRVNSIKAYLIEGNKIRKQPDPLSEIIGNLSSVVPVELIDYYNTDYWLVKSDSVVGFTSSVYLKMTDEIEQLQEAFRQRNEAQMEMEREKERLAIIEKGKIQNAKIKAAEVQRKKKLIAKYGEKTGARIYNGSYWIGMTDVMAAESLGRPRDINKSVGKWGVHEQWVYGDNTYLYFENGILTSYQK